MPISALCTPLAAVAVSQLMLATLTACSGRAGYQIAKGWQQQECRKVGDAAERQRCPASTAGSYDDYRRAREAAEGQP